MNRNNLKALSNANVADSPPNNITAAGLRDLNNEIIGAGATLLDPNSFALPTTFEDNVICNNIVETTIQSGIAPQNTIDLTAVTANYIEISGNSDVITNFGNCQGGEIRFIKFVGSSATIGTAGNIITPKAEPISVEIDDTMIVAGLPSGNWNVINYQRNSGRPFISPIPEWLYLDGGIPDTNINGQMGKRCISYVGGYKAEWMLEDNVNFLFPQWNVMAGTLADATYSADLIINSIQANFNSSMGADIEFGYELYFRRVDFVLEFGGKLKINNTDGGSGSIYFDFSNNQGINIQAFNYQLHCGIATTSAFIQESEYILNIATYSAYEIRLFLDLLNPLPDPTNFEINFVASTYLIP